MDDTKPTNEADQALDFGKKKKKKKDKKDDLLKETETELVSPAAVSVQVGVENEPVAGGGDAQASESTSKDADAAQTATEAVVKEEDMFGKKKTKKTKVKFDDDSNEIIEIAKDDDVGKKKDIDQNMMSESDSACVWQGSERDYTYDELLTRVFNIIHEKNPDMVSGEKKKFIMKPPQVARVGTKKTSFSNFADICKLLKRQEKHLLNFLLAELGASGSLDINKQLTIKGRFQQKQIENVLRRYIKEYVTCHTCRSPETSLVKEERLFFLKCEECGATCSVASIKSGFQAQVGKRAAIRARAT